MTLRIQKAEFFLVKIPLRFSVEHALASRTENITGFVVLTAEDETSGIGEFLCREYVTGETIEDSVRYLEQLGTFLKASTIEEPISFIKSLWEQNTNVRGKSAALCAIELALLDLWGKRERRPVFALLSPNATRSDKMVTFSGVYPFADGLKLAALNLFYRTFMRFEYIKIKGRGEIEKDLTYVRKVRRSFPYPIKIRLDLNASLPPDHAEEYFSKMRDNEADIRWFEQPFPKEAWDVSARFQKRFADSLVFCADESVCSMEDLERTITTGAFRAVNIRIAKNGGLLNALKLYQKAIQKGLQTQLGCMVGESSVLAYAGLHLVALADQLRHHEGCFGKYLVKWDVIQPSLMFSKNGHISLERLPKAGLVPTFNLDRLRKQAFRSGVLEGRP